MPWALLSCTISTINVVLDFLQIKQPKKINKEFNITQQQTVFVSPLSEIHKRRKMAMPAKKGYKGKRSIKERE